MPYAWDGLARGEAVVGDPGEHLWRQFAPGHLEQDGVTLSAQAFRPQERDGRKLSVRRGSLTTAGQAYDEHVAGGRPSLGTLAVTVADAGSLDLRVVDDSAADPPAPQGHAYVDFRPLTRRQATNAAEGLLRCAEGRGWKYQPK